MSIKRAGLIAGNPLHGLCFRECIEVNKVFDGCITRIGDQSFTAPISEPQGTPPFTFVRAVSNGPTVVSNLTVTPVDNRRSRVDFDSTVPILVTYTDSLGATYYTTTSITFHRSVVLTLPEASIAPYTIEVTTTLVSTIGTFNGTSEVNFRACIIQLVKVIAKVDILVPSYGYCEYPVCAEIGVCEGLFNTPLFPPFA